MDRDEVELVGGQVNRVVRIGDTVRRTMAWDRRLSHSVLQHLESVGFYAALRFLGLDDEGRETLSFLPSDLPHDASGFTDDQLIAAARLLRRFHDATEDMAVVRGAGAEVICHNDWTPANTAFRDAMPYALIDFDTVTPGSRLWDLSYSAWAWLDLADPDFSGEQQRHRLAVFCSAYGHASCTLGLVAAVLPSRQAGRARWAKARGMHEGEAWALAAMDWTLEHVTEVIHPTGLPRAD